MASNVREQPHWQYGSMRRLAADYFAGTSQAAVPVDSMNVVSISFTRSA
jgi:hypothetical protein